MAVQIEQRETQDEAAGTMRYLLGRIDELERRVQDLEEWLQEVADDMLDRTEVA